jgi:aspartyl-tRNA(Asn)/glutamyl-tRNA(Gln) amidotransferase subunit B
LLTGRKDVADYFETAVKAHPNPKAISNWVTGDLFRVLKETKLDEQLYITQWPIQAHRLAEMVGLVDQGKISGKMAKNLFDALLNSNRSPGALVAEQGLEQLSDAASIESTVEQVLASNSKQASQYQSGNEKVFGFLVGQVMKATQGKANPQIVNDILKAKLKPHG